jgi:hypothetical protein
MTYAYALMLGGSAITTIACLWLLFLVLTAPEGFQDSDGYHDGRPGDVG